ncbi:DEAD/DEAH box helicase [Xanthovirga aplysinae]|uniref:DEAD/DEAH box helicase n=1 Tax=Xanthovirga aplysinae TaxID=2529853 RepID=UPI0012BC9191|nr:DEAD/DEAH box helicase [Xanthovirga aplysinae]MTI33583.1 DEAD/DEAH box helicase [Xanthovirga aplysinae]
MSSTIKNQRDILNKLGIEALNPMQKEAKRVIHSSSEVVLLSPTGTGKTLAFLLPLISELDATLQVVQALILVPSRELAIQIEQVTREMGAGYKANAIYGGRAIAKDKIDLFTPPAILIGTPGRIADHLRRKTFSTEKISTLVLDEFDKSLEVGFESEMEEIISTVPAIRKKILTSATHKLEMPYFMGLRNPTYLNYLMEGNNQLKIKTITSPTKDKRKTLADALYHLGDKSGIVFCNFKESIQEVSAFLSDKNIKHACFFGGMEQKDRERALIKFRNGTHQLLLATDLAARGIDIPELNFIIHYHLPLRGQEFTHRNGRTARVDKDGTAYIIHWEKETLPDFIQETEIEKLQKTLPPKNSKWETLLISGGRKDKISKGDIAGLFFKQGKLKREHLGTIEIKQDCAFAAVEASQIKPLIQLIDNSKLKRKKIRLKVI